MHDHDRSDPLKAHFEALKARVAEPDAALLARILADAEHEQAVRAAPAARRPRSGWLAAPVRALGGWPAMAGLATAALAGVWIGAAPPEGLAAAAQRMLDANAAVLVIDVDPDAVFILAEGPL
ncbi:MAG: hypothetical protein M5U35_09930 [Roseovarius sp.]|nr:hypothetical protein [Roseovarius sp.]